MTRLDPTGWKVPWDQSRARLLVDSQAWQNRTMAQAAADLVARAPDHIVAVEGQQEFAASAIFGEARRLASALQAKGLKRGDRISYQLPNWHEAMVIDLAATMAGLVVNPLVAIYREAEVGFMLSDLESRMIFVPARFRNHDYRAMMRGVRTGLDHHVDVIVLRGEAEEFIAYAELLASGNDDFDPAPVDPDDIKLVLYTSGTTGRAKAALHSHNTVGAIAEQFRRHMAIGSQDVSLVASPVTHITGAILAFQLPWVAGAKAVLMDVWDGDRAVELIRGHAVTLANGAAPFIVDLLAAAARVADRLPSLRVFVAGGSAIPEALGRSVYDNFENCVMFRAYGATEVPTATVGVLDRAYREANITTDGRPVFTELKIVDPETGRKARPGEVGEILMRGPQMLLGYLRPDDNAGAFDEEGFFRSGDLGRFVRDDWIEITGRSKDIIIRAGENISPQEIEEALLDCEKIAQIAIVAKPNPRTGEAACAFVVPRGELVPTLDEMAALLARKGFAKQKTPEHLVVVASLPMTPAGKVKKHVLREWAAGNAAVGDAK